MLLRLRFVPVFSIGGSYAGNNKLLIRRRSRIICHLGGYCRKIDAAPNRATSFLHSTLSFDFNDDWSGGSFHVNYNLGWNGLPRLAVSFVPSGPLMPLLYRMNGGMSKG